MSRDYYQWVDARDVAAARELGYEMSYCSVNAKAGEPVLMVRPRIPAEMRYLASKPEWLTTRLSDIGDDA
jgi:hypothetical protein